MAGTVEFNEERHGGNCRIKAEWTTDETGTAEGTTNCVFSGVIWGVEAVPGNNPPIAVYDIIIEDKDGIDILHGLGSNMSQLSAEHLLACDISLSVVNTRLKFKIDNGEDEKNGTIILCLRE